MVADRHAVYWYQRDPATGRNRQRQAVYGSQALAEVAVVMCGGERFPAAEATECIGCGGPIPEDGWAECDACETRMSSTTPLIVCADCRLPTRAYDTTHGVCESCDLRGRIA